jgi:flagellar protein FliS
MHEATGIKRYQATDLESMAPEKILVLLYEAIDRHLRRALRAGQNDEHALLSRSVGAAQSILRELRQALNHDQGGQIAANLDTLYDFMYLQNLAFLGDRDPRRLEGVLRVLAPILSAWRQIPMGTREAALRGVQSLSGEPASSAVQEPARPGTSQHLDADGRSHTAAPPPPGRSSLSLSA